MTCRYCTAQNDDDNHRCKRCGRRLHTDATPIPVSNSSLAPVLDPNPAPAVERPPQLGPRIVPPQAAPVTGPREPAYQASLFGPQEVTKPRDSAAPRPRPSAPKPRRERPEQATLEFTDSIDATSTVQSSIYCKSTVAPAPLRVAAVIFDLLYPAIGTGLFWAALHYGGAQVAIASIPVWVYLPVVVVSALLYRTLYCLGNTDTPGVRWAGMKLIDFDGRRPTRTQRFKRFAGGAISIVAAGLGVIWALLDEEKLTWHDHMSGTFPTIADQSLFANRRA